MKRNVFPAIVLLALLPAAWGGTLVGHLRDPNWFAQYQSNPYGVGWYECAINANGANLSSLGGGAATGIYGEFQMDALPAGSYTVASWDPWWRSAFAFNVPVPASGSSADVDLRLRATMWGYAAFWSSTGYSEFGQTFVATGPITMIYLRNPQMTSPTYTVTVHEGGPGGAQVGDTRAFNGYWDIRLIYGQGQMPTVKGRTYYLRLRAPTTGVICQMDPRPDFSDPMPGGCLYLGNGGTPTAYPDRDLGVTIMSDDDGLITDLLARGNGSTFSGVTSVGQTFVARGVGLISAAFWLADPTAPIYVVRVLENGPAGAQVGTTKRGKPARLGADPEMLVTWAPGECPLTTGQTYYVEVTKDGGGAVNAVIVNTGNPFPFGQAYQNGAPVSGADLAGTLMEEESAGSAAKPAVKILQGPSVVESTRGTNQFTVTWTTDAPSDSAIEYAIDNPPYRWTTYAPELTNVHFLTVTHLYSHALYHWRVTSAAANYRPAISRDLVICTRPSGSNLLVNPGFEEGAGASPRSVIPGWIKSGLDIQASSGNWFGGLQPTNGAWFCQGAVNSGSSDGYLCQRVSGVTPGYDYTFSAWVMTAPRESDRWKYDVWDRSGRLIYVRLGVDPTGGNDVNAASVQWTPRMYSHRYYTQVAKTAVAQGTNLSVFIHLKGDLQYSDPGTSNWHLYAVDDCALTHEDAPIHFGPAVLLPSNRLQMVLEGRPNQTYSVQSSTTFTNWLSMGTVFNTNGAVQFTIPGVTNYKQRFFRARLGQ